MSSAIPASELVKLYIATATSEQRESLILSHVSNGLVPSWVYNTTDVTIRNNKGDSVVLTVFNDYLTVGTDENFLRVPTFPKTAETLASMFGCVLPTPKMVDEIYRHPPSIRLAPAPYSPKSGDPSRAATKTYVWHNQQIEQQLLKKGFKAGNQLVVGHKKDIVVCKALKANPDRLFIYGWHQLNGKPIQGLSDAHSATYVDYSHGVRLVKNNCLLNGTSTTVEQVLANPLYVSLLGNEGVLVQPHYKL